MLYIGMYRDGGSFRVNKILKKRGGGPTAPSENETYAIHYFKITLWILPPLPLPRK